MNLSPREAEAAVLQHRIPLSSRRVLHVNCGPGLLCGVAARRSGAETTGVYLGQDAQERATAEGQATRVAETLAVAALVGAPFDCVVISGLPPEDAHAALRRCAEYLVPDGCAVVLSGEALPADTAPLAPYALWPIDAAQAELDEEFTPADNSPRVTIYTYPSYDPLAHAQQLAGARLFDQAYEILCAVPPARRADPALDARVQVLKIVCLLGLQRLGAYPPLTCLAAGLFLFARVQRRMPNQPETLRLAARFWEAIGDAHTSARYRVIADELAGIPPTVEVPPVALQSESPATEWSAPARPPRVLFVMGDTRVDYGLDLLYHGLKIVLGEENVSEFPPKPSLHGAVPEKFAHYPALFNHADHTLEVDAVVASLRAGHFDLVAWGDTDMQTDTALARTLREAAGTTPIAFVDMRDDCADHVPDLCAWLGISTPGACFKRELLATAQYAGAPASLPFAYADEFVAAGPGEPRSGGIFWAGQRGWGLRDIFLPALEAHGIDTRAKYTQDAYRAALRAAGVCISLAGAGFDTVRYWEAPAQACLLLTEALPICIPHNFTDMRDALIFDTLKGLNERVEYLAAHPAEVEAMRVAGWERLRAHHTASARARQFLARAFAG